MQNCFYVMTVLLVIFLIMTSKNSPDEIVHDEEERSHSLVEWVVEDITNYYLDSLTDHQLFVELTGCVMSPLRAEINSVEDAVFVIDDLLEGYSFSLIDTLSENMSFCLVRALHDTVFHCKIDHLMNLPMTKDFSFEYGEMFYYQELSIVAVDSILIEPRKRWEKQQQGFFLEHPDIMIFDEQGKNVAKIMLEWKGDGRCHHPFNFVEKATQSQSFLGNQQLHATQRQTCNEPVLQFLCFPKSLWW